MGEMLLRMVLVLMRIKLLEDINYMHMVTMHMIYILILRQFYAYQNEHLLE